MRRLRHTRHPTWRPSHLHSISINLSRAILKHLLIMIVLNDIHARLAHDFPAVLLNHLFPAPTRVGLIRIDIRHTSLLALEVLQVLVLIGGSYGTAFQLLLVVLLVFLLVLRVLGFRHQLTVVAVVGLHCLSRWIHTWSFFKELLL